MSQQKNYVEIPPNAGRTLAALRELGYDSMSAIADLIDNSLDAKAQNVVVTIRAVGKSFIVEIADDGYGMSRDTLTEAIRLGSDIEGRELNKDLGKYGMGLVTASLSIAKTIYVVSREKGKPANEATFDVGTVEKEGKWLLELRPATKHGLDAVGDYGTVVRLSNVDRLDDTNVTRIGERLRAHVGQVFREFIKDGVKIKVNGKVVAPIDPLMRDHPATEIRFDAPISVGRDKMIRLTIVELPDLGPMEDEKAGITPQRSGFYVVRNRREIVGAQTFGMYKHHHSYSHFRAEIRFSGELDQDFHVDVKKTSITPNDQIVEKIQEHARRWLERSGREGRDRAIAKTTLTHNLSRDLIAAKPHNDKPHKAAEPVAFDETDFGTPDELFRFATDGQTRLNYNKRHPLIQLVAAAKLQKGIAILDIMALAIAKVAEERDGDKLIESFNLALKAILAPKTETWEERDANVNGNAKKS